ncbi:hypothetical protein ACJX0J_016011, partial [Zea mays]
VLDAPALQDDFYLNLVDWSSHNSQAASQIQVTFSRIDPGGKLVMGFRKATNTVSLPDSQISAIADGSLLSETLFSTANESIGV